MVSSECGTTVPVLSKSFVKDIDGVEALVPKPNLDTGSTQRRPSGRASDSHVSSVPISVSGGACSPATKGPVVLGILMCWMSHITLKASLKWLTIGVSILCGIVIGQHFCLVACGTLDAVGEAIISSVQSFGFLLPMFSYLGNGERPSPSSANMHQFSDLAHPHAHRQVEPEIDLLLSLLHVTGPPKQLLLLGTPGVLIFMAWRLWMASH